MEPNFGKKVLSIISITFDYPLIIYILRFKAGQNWYIYNNHGMLASE